MTIREVDVAIIGAGSAGLAALREVRKKTDNFVLINDGPFGSTCARVGCMPSKALIEQANAFHKRHLFRDFGIRGGGHLQVDIPAALERVRSLRDGFIQGPIKRAEELGERCIAARARFIEPGILEVNGNRIKAAKVIIASGSRPAVPDEWQAFGDRILTTDTLFEQEDLPARIAVVGFGLIGAEIAQALSRFGLEVTAFGSHELIAGITDPVINEAALELLRAEFPIHLEDRATIAEGPGGALIVRDAGKEVVVDKVLAAVGRRSNADRTGVEALGVPLDERGMPPFDRETMQVEDLPVFIAGDVNGDLALLHEAVDEGHIAGMNATAREPACFRRRTPLSIVFTDPQIALVGKAFRDLPEDDSVAMGEVSFARQGRAMTAGTNKGKVRVYARKASGLILGAEMCVPAAEHLAHLLALAIQQRLTVRDILRMPVYHPVLEEGLRGAIRKLARELPGGMGSDLAGCEDIGAEAID